MEDFFEISLGHGEDLQTFIVKDFVQQEDSKCKFEVYRLGELILSLEPDGDTFHICQNPGEVKEEMINQIIDQIESYHL
ncbi:hypothetical protein [Mucilaginibacter panaciglaebae]|uniref:DUF1292 domain-containing protein n=1 Tax=Mucilaginibacter panaciglaebae TaxID=502331 RepID=A0ABP7WKS5_9SPHI